MLHTSVFRLLDLIDTQPSKEIRFSEIPEDLRDSLTIALHHGPPLVEKEPPPGLPKVIPPNLSPEAKQKLWALAAAANQTAANPTYSLTSAGRYELAMQRVGPREEAGEWLTVSDAARASACTNAQISGAVRDGQLKSNGQKGRERRIDAADLVLWQLRRSKREGAVESDAAVEKKMKRAQDEQRNNRPS
jgi:hypothetical protein